MYSVIFMEYFKHNLLYFCNIKCQFSLKVLAIISQNLTKSVFVYHVYVVLCTLLYPDHTSIASIPAHVNVKCQRLDPSPQLDALMPKCCCQHIFFMPPGPYLKRLVTLNIPI